MSSENENENTLTYSSEVWADFKTQATNKSSVSGQRSALTKLCPGQHRAWLIPVLDSTYLDSALGYQQLSDDMTWDEEQKLKQHALNVITTGNQSLITVQCTRTGFGGVDQWVHHYCIPLGRRVWRRACWGPVWRWGGRPSAGASSRLPLGRSTPNTSHLILLIKAWVKISKANISDYNGVKA